ncbi:MAG: hypothetical protein HOP18_09325 [Deltaproteobacteria bacterium]|nr:hypothetical protein [Deltaproteobacteria bacterium]
MIVPKQVFLGCSFQKRTNTYIHLAQDAAEEFGAHLVFGDNNPRAVQIRDTAFNLIESSRLVILDLSRESVNVGVEYGFSQGLKKKHVYLLAQKPAFGDVQLPAMFKGLQYKTYSGLGGFNNKIIECLAQHFVRSRMFIDEMDREFQWLQREVLDLVGELGRATRSDLSDALNCHAPDVTKAAAVLVDRGVIGRDPNGPDPIYFKLNAPVFA